MNMSSAENGSSMHRSAGPRARARANPTRCFMPPESSLGYASSKPSRPMISSTARRAAPLRPAPTGAPRLPGRCSRARSSTDRARSSGTPTRRQGERRREARRGQHLAPRGREEPDHRPQERRLAAALAPRRATISPGLTASDVLDREIATRRVIGHGHGANLRDGRVGSGSVGASIVIPRDCTSAQRDERGASRTDG